MNILRKIGYTLNLLIIGSIFLALISCSSDDSTSSSSGGGSTSYTTYSGSAADIFYSMKSQVESRISCGSRLDVHFEGQAVSSTTIMVYNTAPIGLPSSEVTTFNIGENSLGDIMVVCQLVDGRFIVSISLCPYTSIISSSSTATSFYTPSGIVRSFPTSSTMGTLITPTATQLTIQDVIGPVETVFREVNIAY